jgi:pimeloyl-ACP methyl ester carboxylesterase
VTALDVKLCGVCIDGNNWVSLRDLGNLAEYKKGAPVSMQIHTGFLKQYLAIRDTLMKALQKHEDADEIVITGHSLGGALATLAALDLNRQGIHKISTVTFGAPRVGDQLFADLFETLDTSNQSFRIFKDRDPIPQILMSPQYFHVGKGLLLDDLGNLRHLSKDLECILRPFLMLGTLNTRTFVVEHSTETYINLLLKP